MAMGTDCRIEFRSASRAAARAFCADSLAWLEEFERKYSRFLPDSMISAINRAAGREGVAIDAELEGIFSLCDWYHWVTAGVFDPTALPLRRLWDYKAANPVVPSDGQIAQALSLVGWRRVERASGSVRLPLAGMAIDIGGIGKEYAVDRVAAMAADMGIRDVLVDFGRDIRVLGQPPEGGPWRIGLEHPLLTDKCWGGVALRDMAVATSGDYRRLFVRDGKRYGHIIDPRTGRPADNGCRSVSVVAPTCTEAGILATAAFVLGPQDGLDLIEKSHHAAGVVWTDAQGTRSRRFDHYEIRDERP